jgi:hypothetical protein
MIRAVMPRAAEGHEPFALKHSSVELSFPVAEDGSI